MPQDPEKITIFAQTDARGQNVPFGIKAKDRTRHVYVIGKTGMGKSTLLENMAVQDIKNGNGFAFIDPHGQTAETLLNYIPEERKDDVLYFAPFDTQHPVSFNVMEDVGPDRRHLVVSGLMSVFKKIWVDAWSARMEYILSNTLLALLEYPDSTLLGVNRMLSDKVYRRKVIDNISDPAVKSFWVDEFLNYNERYMQEAGDAIKNKIGQFTSNPLIRNIVGQPKSSFDIRKIMDERKILIMNLSKGLVGESNANLLGSMLTTRIYLAAMSRADLSQEQMKNTPNFYFFVDEFQSFANATFADILSEARKYKLNLTIAHQYIEQMEEEVRNAVFGNVGTIVSFRVGPFDAEVLESIFTPKFLAPDIVNLGFAQIYLTLMIDGIGSAPFSATTLAPIAPPSVSCKEMVIANSRKLYARERTEVENAIVAWHAPDPAVASNKKHDEKKTKSYKNDNSSYKPRQQDGTTRAPYKRTENEQTKIPREYAKQNNERKQTPRHNNEKTAEDLRSILKNISKSENSASQHADKKSGGRTNNTSETTEQKNNADSRRNSQESNISQTDKKSPQKDALKNALHQVLQEKASTKKEQVPKTANHPSKKIEHDNASQELAESTLSPKKLERMMHVGVNDKAPLK